MWPTDKAPATKFTYNVSSGWTLRYSDHTFFHIVVPASDTPDGVTDCLIWGPEDKKLIPKYPTPLRNPPTRNFEIRSAGDPKMGLGLFATRDFQVGDLILHERPILLVPRLLDSAFITGALSVNSPAHQAAWQSIFCPFFERVSKEKQNKYRALANGYPEDELVPLMGTWRTNSLENSLHITGEQGNMYTAVYEHGSRVNHRWVYIDLSGDIVMTTSAPQLCCRKLRAEI
jgi:hypothetical protein